MLPTSEIVRNALLALASTYLLGYTPDENLRILANRYYHLAVVGLTKRLQDAEQWEIGKGDDIVATFSLLNLHDVSFQIPDPIMLSYHTTVVAKHADNHTGRDLGVSTRLRRGTTLVGGSTYSGQISGRHRSRLQILQTR